MDDEDNQHRRHRRLETPGERVSRAATRSRSLRRSRSRHQARSPSHRTRDQQELESSRERLNILESELRREQERVRAAEDRLRERSSGSRVEQRRRRASPTDARDAELPTDAGQHTRSRSPSFSKRDIIDIFKCIKDGFVPQSTTEGTQSFSKVDHKNILPEFDPSNKNQRVDIWLKKVNECASVYGWDDRTTTHFAMQKLQGLAKTWYEGLNSILYNWKEWQEKLLSAFPYEQNYGQALEDMLRRKTKFHEPIENYYYEKLALINQCDIVGKRAVDCIIHGITDRTLRSGALALRCSHPDQLLQYLVSHRDSYHPVADRMHFKSKTSDSSNQSNNVNHRPVPKTSQAPGCYNCKEKGHSFLYCPKPLLKCTRCFRVGHTLDSCNLQNKSDDRNSPSTIPKTLRINSKDELINQDLTSKFIKNITVNGTTLQAFVDFGSDVTLIRKSVVIELGLNYNPIRSCMKGFGNSIVQSLGELPLDIRVDCVNAVVPCKVVEDHLLDKPILLGQTYTEQPHIIVYKDASALKFLDIGREMPLSGLDFKDDSLLKVTTLAPVKLYGAASVRARIEPSFSGSIVIRNSIAGKPDKQYFVTGGIYKSENDSTNVEIIPCSGYCELSEGSLFSRAERVNLVNNIVRAPPELGASNIDESKVHIGDNVSNDEKERLMQLLRKYKHCFASSLKELGCTNVTEMKIELNSQRPVVYRPYRLSHHEREKVRTMIDEMLEAGIVRESTSEYSSPILLVRKKDGSFRLCVDYRLLNSVTIKERYPIPIIEDEIARLSGQGCFITLDLASGYYQVPIAEQSKHLTSFVTPDGQYEFNRMPFGLANAPAVFQRMINAVLGSARFNKAAAYIDDVLIFGRDCSECLERLEEILNMIEKANLTLNLSKCDFLRDKIDYLGYEISAKGVRPGEKKILSVQNFPRPENVHNVRQFLGLASYFRKFTKGFAQIASPLSKLLKKNVAWEWGDSQEKAFEALKVRLIERPTLAIYDPTAEIELHTDASRLGVGGILLQRHASSGIDDLHPIAYYSRQTSPEEKNFHSYELETLAVVASLRKFRVYLLGKEFKIVTDCSALRSTFSKRDLIPRIARWWLMLQEFNCTIEYRPGPKMNHVDALSRNPPLEPVDTVPSLEEQYPSVMSISGEDWLQTLQLGDSELCRIKDILSSGLNEKGLQYLRENYTIKDNKLFRCLGGDQNDCRWVVPKGARWQLCRMNHDDIGHFGFEKTLERLRRNYWFPKMTRFVRKYVDACVQCAYAKNKTHAREGLLHPIEKIEKPFHTLHIDHLGPFVRSNRGFSYLLVVVDAFTKFCFIKPVRNTNTANVIRILDEIFHTFRTPDRLVSDRGSCFTSHAFKRFCLDKGVKHVLNAVASPRSNGQVERYNRTILDSLKTLNEKHGEKDWDIHVGKVQWGLNNTVQKTTGKMPSEVLFGAEMCTEANPMFNEISEVIHKDCDLSSIRHEVKDRIDKEQMKQKLRYDSGRKAARMYKVGELVKITKTCYKNDGQSKKLMPSYVGPYRVTKILGNDRYNVSPIPGLSGTRNKRQTVVAADRMSPWIHIAALELEDDSDNDNRGAHSNVREIDND